MDYFIGKTHRDGEYTLLVKLSIHQSFSCEVHRRSLLGKLSLGSIYI